MAALEFPENPVLNQTYDFPPFQYIWDGAKWKTVGRGADTVAEAINTHKSAVDQHSIAGVAGLQEALDSLAGNSGDPVLSAKWVQKRSAMWTGYAAGDGQELSRALYPDAWAAINAGLVPVCTKAEWIADPAKRGCFHTGDGSTTFGLPDYNGAQPGSYGPVYLGGGTAGGGAILRDRIQNITGTTTTGNPIVIWGGTIENVGAISLEQSKTSIQASSYTSTVNAGYDRIRFDASLVARTGETTRPITAEGCIAIKLFGAVQNTGSADAAALATAVAALAARVTALEARKSTCLVNAVGTGAPHETVSAALPANITINSRYVLDNPFGVNVPVDCKLQILVNGSWGDPGFQSFVSGSTEFFRGARAEWLSGVGIVVVTGKTCVGSGAGYFSGAPFSTTELGTSYPCRVYVRRIDD